MKYPQLVPMPSAVSDWLEEQLEARGVDAAIYTRYILSLLHSDAVDVVHPDESQFSYLKKEVRRSGGGHKCFRSSKWLDQSHLDELKRLAVIKCLLSASDQNCEVESLVDELCQKLKEAENENKVSAQPYLNKPELRPTISPRELARQYYAAFPPLYEKSALSSPGVHKSFLPKRIKSPKKYWKTGRSSSFENKLHCRTETEGMKARFGKQRHNRIRHKEVGTNRTILKTTEENRNQMYPFGKDAKIKSSASCWGQILDLKIDSIADSTNVPINSDQCIEGNPDWQCEEDVNMYEDLLVDIGDLLDSPSPQKNKDTTNMYCMKEEGKRKFLSCGTNITSSIWSEEAAIQTLNFDNSFNSFLGSGTSDLLDLKFSSITIDNNANKGWPDYFCPSTEECQNNTSPKLQEYHVTDDSNFIEQPVSNPPASNLNENFIASSLKKLNHCNKSSFTQFKPQGQSNNSFKYAYSKCWPNVKGTTVNENKSKEDLLTSLKSHFQPIKPNMKIESHAPGQYVDGSTFIISSKLNSITYKRSESGFMCLESESGICKKYSEFKWDASGKKDEFILKFSISQNDKACQTDLSDIDLDRKKCCQEEMLDAVGLGSASKTKDKILAMDYAIDVSGGGFMYPEHSDGLLSEVMWKNEEQFCDKCNNNTFTWNGNGLRNFEIDANWRSIRKIWSGVEVCSTCLELDKGRPPPSLQQVQLREDVSQDGEQLLSDLSSLQQSYEDGLPINEITCDFTVPKEQKRRHSCIATHVEDVGVIGRRTWSFASRLEKDCLIKMSTLPTLRSVTL